MCWVDKHLSNNIDSQRKKLSVKETDALKQNALMVNFAYRYILYYAGLNEIRIYVYQFKFTSRENKVSSKITAAFVQLKYVISWTIGNTESQ